MIYKVWYMRSEFFRDGINGTVPAADLVSTHIHLRDLQRPHTPVTDIGLIGELEAVWREQQAENWSPKGEANPLIDEKGLGHTSMCMGDFIEVTGDGPYAGTLWLCDRIGFTQLVRKQVEFLVKDSSLR